MFGDATFYCWLGAKMWQFVALYLWVALAIVYVCVILFITHVHVARRAQRQGNLDAIESSWLIMLKLRIYMIAFVILWLPSLIYRSKYRSKPSSLVVCSGIRLLFVLGWDSLYLFTNLCVFSNSVW